MNLHRFLIVLFMVFAVQTVAHAQCGGYKAAAAQAARNMDDAIANGQSLSEPLADLNHLKETCHLTFDQLGIKPSQVASWKAAVNNEGPAVATKPARIPQPAEPAYSWSEEPVRSESRPESRVAPSSSSGCDNQTDLLVDPVYRNMRDIKDGHNSAAFAAADLLSHRTRVAVSAADIQELSDSSRGNFFGRSMTGLTPKDIMMPAVRQGLCPEARFQSTNGAQQAELEKEFNRLGDKDATDQECALGRQAALKMFPKKSLMELTQIVYASKFHIFSKTVTDQAKEQYCNRRPSSFDVEEEGGGDASTPADLLKSVDRQLNRKNPVLIVFDGGAIGNGMHATGEPNFAALIIDHRRSSSGQCEYLVRPPWGNSCSVIKQGFECDNGNAWVPASTLRSLHTIDYVK